MMDKKIFMEMVSKEYDLNKKVENELKNLNDIFYFGNVKRIGLSCFYGVGRCFYSSNNKEMKNIIIKILIKYYNIVEVVLKKEGKINIIYFYYDCSSDGRKEIFVE